MIFNSLEVPIVVILNALSLLELVSNYDIFIKRYGLFVRDDGLSKFKQLNQCQGFSPVGFGEVAFDVDARVTILDALVEHVEIVIADGTIWIKTMIFWLAFYCVGIVLYGLLVVFILKGLVALFFPLLGGLLDLHV